VNPPFEKRQRRQISAYNVSTVRASKSLIVTNSKSTIGFPTFQQAIDEVRTLPLSPPQGGSKSEFVGFLINIYVE